MERFHTGIDSVPGSRPDHHPDHHRKLLTETGGAPVEAGGAPEPARAAFTPPEPDRARRAGAEHAGGLQLVLERNHFYRDRYRLHLRVTAALLILSSLLVLLLFWVVTHPPAPRYFATTPNGGIIPLVPLDQPYKANDAISQWAADVARKAYSFDFVHWRGQLNQLARYFTGNGYEQFLSALKKSGNVAAVRDKRLVGTAIASPAIITSEGPLNSVYTWEVEVPLQVRYSSARETIKQSLLITMTVQRTNTLKNEHGLAVNRFLSLTR